MTPTGIRERVVAERASWTRQMLAELARLPLESPADFAADPRNAAAAESFLRRALEALLDLGRHVLAKGFGRVATEYKAIPQGLVDVGALGAEEGELMREMAGYRNRMVHFYDEIGADELFQLCQSAAGDVGQVLDALLRWLDANPERIDRS